MAKTAEKSSDTSKAKGAQSSRELLIETAARLFAQNGYNKTNMRELAEAVGMKAGSIFYHFKGKEEILFAVMERAISDLLEAVQKDIVPAETPRQRLRVLVRTELDMFLGDQSSYGLVLIHEWRSLTADLQQDLMSMRAEYESLWNATLADCHLDGIIKANPKIVRRLLNGAFSWVIYWYKADGECNFEQLVDEVMLMLVNPSAG
ncbi:MAG: TetR/AcrR family transcriptional regulator [Motiliproteus sp.]